MNEDYWLRSLRRNNRSNNFLSNKREFNLKEMKRDEELQKLSNKNLSKSDFELKKLIVFLKKNESNMNLKNKSFKKNFKNNLEDQNLYYSKTMSISKMIRYHSMLIVLQLKDDWVAQGTTSNNSLIILSIIQTLKDEIH